MSWRVADYDGTPTKEAFCPYWRCSAEQNFEMHERVEGGDVQEAEFRCPDCGRTLSWANREAQNLQVKRGDWSPDRVAPAPNGT